MDDCKPQAPDRSAGVPLDDRGLLLGDGLFETLLWREGELVLGEAHAGRMIRSAQALAIPAPPRDAFLSSALNAVRAARLESDRAAVRVTLTAGSGGRGLDRPASLETRLFATAAPSIRPEKPATLVAASIRRNEASPVSRLKTLAYLDNVLARREARLAGADEAVMLNTSGDVACAAAANIFWVSGGIVHTPPAEAGRLDGIMAAEVMRAAQGLGLDVRQSRAPLQALFEADEVFITSSLIGVRRASLPGKGAARWEISQALAQALARVA
jgi:branched-subunit amino acid aminotransferase/4-amino-4-deoxychorismate lyase